MTSILVDARLAWGSGIGRYVQNVAPAVARAMPDVRFVIQYLEGGSELPMQLFGGMPNVDLVESDIPAFSLKEQLKGPHAFAGHDLVWFTNYWVPLGFRQPFVAIVYDLLHLEREFFPASGAKRLLSYLTFAHIAHRADTLYFISHFSKDQFEKRFGKRTIHIMSSLGIDHIGGPPLRHEVPKKSARILIVAAAKSHKNFELAVRAFLTAEIASHWRLTIISPADALRTSINLEKIAANDSRIDLRWGVSDEELASLYDEAAILLMPSRYEGFGLPLAEGMQAGAQCISSTAPALVELGGDAPVVFLDPLDQTAWSRSIEKECSRFDNGEVSAGERLAGMKRADEFTWGKVVDTTVTSLREALLRARQGR